MTPIDTVLQKGNSSYQKYLLAKMAPNINGMSQNWHLTKVAHQNLDYWFSEVLPTLC